MDKRGFAYIRPIFNEEAEYLKRKLKIEIPTGKCFMEKNVIKAFITQNKTINLYKVTVDQMNSEIRLVKKYAQKGHELISWNCLVQLYADRLLSLEKDSMGIIGKYFVQYESFESIIFASGGKDSSVLTYLVRKVRPDIKVYYNNTSNEVADHYKFVKKIPNHIIINPKEGFIKYCERENFIPSRFARACCRIYKHEITRDKLDSKQKYLFFMGMRNIESAKRAEYEDEHNPEYYPENWKCILPIRKWNTLDIWLYLFMNQIEINPLYKKGYSRCGCIICPFRNPYDDILTKEFYPTYIKRFEKLFQKNFVENKRWIYLNCTLKEFIDYAWKEGKVRDIPSNEVISEFADYMGINTKVAEKYFNQACTCQQVNTNPKQLNSLEIALSLKLFGRDTKKLLCLECLAKELAREDVKKLGERPTKKAVKDTISIWRKKLLSMAQEFRDQGCNLF